jgi:hypothetical protein
LEEKMQIINGFKLSTGMYLKQHSLRNFALMEDAERVLLRENETELVLACLNQLNATLSNAGSQLASLPAPESFSSTSGTDVATMSHVQKNLQTEIQKVFLRVNVLSARLDLTDQLSALLGPDAASVTTQRYLIIEEMALLLKNMSKTSIEPSAKLLVRLTFWKLSTCNELLINIHRLQCYATCGIPLLESHKELNRPLRSTDTSQLALLSCSTDSKQ